MDRSDDKWNAERDRLQNDFIAAALSLREHVGKARFTVPVADQSLIITVTPIGLRSQGEEEELEREISDDATKLYDIKHEKYVDIEIKPESASDPYLHITIGPEESPPEDDPDDESLGNKA